MAVRTWGRGAVGRVPTLAGVIPQATGPAVEKVRDIVGLYLIAPARHAARRGGRVANGALDRTSHHPGQVLRLEEADAIVSSVLHLDARDVSQTPSPTASRTPSATKYRFAAFWASVLVVIGVVLAVVGVLFALVALTLDMPWSGLTGQAVAERTLVAFVLIASGILAGGPFIVLGQMMRIFLDQRELIERIERRLEGWEDQARRGVPPA